MPPGDRAEHTAPKKGRENEMMQKAARTVVIVALCLAAFRLTASADEGKGTPAIGSAL